MSFGRILHAISPAPHVEELPIERRNQVRWRLALGVLCRHRFRNRRHIWIIVIITRRMGMGAALLEGAPVATQDLDLWFESTTDGRIREAARDAGGF